MKTYDRARMHRALDAVMDSRVATLQRDNQTFEEFKRWTLSVYPSARFSSRSAFVTKRNGAVHKVGEWDDVRERGYLDREAMRRAQVKDAYNIKGMSWHAAYEKAQNLWGTLATVQSPASAYSGRSTFGKWGSYKVGVRPYAASTNVKWYGSGDSFETAFQDAASKGHGAA